jgi:hypothetical protein
MIAQTVQQLQTQMDNRLLWVVVVLLLAVIAGGAWFFGLRAWNRRHSKR